MVGCSRLLLLTLMGKEYRKTLVRHETVLSHCGCPLVQLLLGVVYLSTDITTKLFKILYSIIALNINLLCSSVGHPNCCSYRHIWPIDHGHNLLHNCEYHMQTSNANHP